MNDLDYYTDTALGWFDKIIGAGIKGVNTFYDTKVAVNQRQAELALAESQAAAARDVAQLDVGTRGSFWADNTSPDYFNDLATPQNVLIAGGVLLVAFALMKGK